MNVFNSYKKDIL